jgi:hypothetical protein
MEERFFMLLVDLPRKGNTSFRKVNYRVMTRGVNHKSGFFHLEPYDPRKVPSAGIRVRFSR